VQVGDRLADGRRAVWVKRAGVPVGPETAEIALAAAGDLPLPPYVHRPLADPGRYQTVFATRPGSVAAPTAGLHLTADLLAAAAAQGAEVVPVELVVGLDTFRPITADDPAQHVIHTERYRVPETTWNACRTAERVVAVGTTSVRALESVAATGELSGRTDLFIHPPYRFAVVDVLLTNFHLPRSTLLLLVEAFIGPRWRELYRAALADGYRFLSLGDAMLLGAE
jgi:S-adenosylmethionine:tRNA ribosyltransferase-isomerase